jgi:hypothetical protein
VVVYIYALLARLQVEVYAESLKGFLFLFSKYVLGQLGRIKPWDHATSDKRTFGAAATINQVGTDTGICNARTIIETIHV